jgi:hypothetical protein
VWTTKLAPRIAPQANLASIFALPPSTFSSGGLTPRDHPLKKRLVLTVDIPYSRLESDRANSHKILFNKKIF